MPDQLPLQLWARNETFMNMVRGKGAELNGMVGDIPEVKRSTEGKNSKR